jgi:hypothetical protein
MLLVERDRPMLERPDGRLAELVECTVVSERAVEGEG